MGYDVTIRSFIIRDGIATETEYKMCTYLSFYWNDYSKICPVHFPDGPCLVDCEYVHLWHVNDDCHARRGDDVCNRSLKALKILKSYGINPGTPDPENDGWEYGIRYTYDPVTKRITVQLPLKERASIFAYHLQRFRDLGLQYPQCFFLTDSHDDQSNLILPNGTIIPRSQTEDSSDESSDESDKSLPTSKPKSHSVTYYHHPSNGCCRVDSNKLSIPLDRTTYYQHPFRGLLSINSFKTAMEIFGFLTAQNDNGAQKWFDLALTMPDAPDFTLSSPIPVIHITTPEDNTSRSADDDRSRSDRSASADNDASRSADGSTSSECSPEDQIQQSNPVAYHWHPTKGIFCVNSFKTAIEIFGLLSAQNDDRASEWFDLAMDMPDVPNRS
jgi:hypothetical protein